MELGAFDGQTGNMFAPSQSGDFVELGWRRILIEANPSFRAALIKHSPDAYSVNAAICNKKYYSMEGISSSKDTIHNVELGVENKPGSVYYIFRAGGRAPTGGIVQFFTFSFLETFYPFLLVGEGVNRTLHHNLSAISLPSDTTLVEIPCLPLQKVLDVALTTKNIEQSKLIMDRNSNNSVNESLIPTTHMVTNFNSSIHLNNITSRYKDLVHINFFVLDVEGAELEVLKTINWRRTTFDILCIETDREHRSQGYGENVTIYMKDRGYEFLKYKGRNSWYMRNGFIPSIRPSNSIPPPPLNNHGEF